MRWLRRLWPWHRRGNGGREQREVAAGQALAEQQRKLADAERSGVEVRKVAGAIERRLAGDFAAQVEAALARRQR